MLKPKILLPVDPRLWEAELEGTIAANEILLSRDRYPPLYTSGIRYKPERGEHWQHVDEILSAGEGDCEDLVCWRVARTRLSGGKARPKIYKTGPKRWHTVVEHGDGTIEDPSRILIEKQKAGKERKAMKRVQVDIRPVGKYWQAEMIIPGRDTEITLKGIGINPRAAGRKICMLGQFATPGPAAAPSDFYAALMKHFQAAMPTMPTAPAAPTIPGLPAGFPWGAIPGLPTMPTIPGFPTMPTTPTAAPTGIAELMKSLSAFAPALGPYGAAAGAAMNVATKLMETPAIKKGWAKVKEKCKQGLKKLWDKIKIWGPEELGLIDSDDFVALCEALALDYELELQK